MVKLPKKRGGILEIFFITLLFIMFFIFIVIFGVILSELNLKLESIKKEYIKDLSRVWLKIEEINKNKQLPLEKENSTKKPKKFKNLK